MPSETSESKTTKRCPSCKEIKCECTTNTGMPKITPEEFMAKQFADPEIKAVYERLAKR